MDLQEEIQKALHAKPTWATTGEESLDFLIVEAERITSAGKAELERIRAEVWADHLELSEALEFKVKEIIRGVRYNAGDQLTIISGRIEYREARGRTVIEQRNAKPQGSTDAEIAQRWQSLTRLLDSKPQKSILAAMGSESASDPLSRYLLRGRDAELYCQAKGLPVVDFFRMIEAAADILEKDIWQSSQAVALALEQREAMVPCWQKFMWSLDVLGQIGATIFGPVPFASRKPIRAQSAADGSVNISFPDMNSFKEWARTPRA